MKKATKKAVMKKVAVKSGRQRRMISVPAKLHECMEQYTEVNWSSVACHAFELKLGELAQAKEEKNMSDVVARLRASKLKADSESYGYGVEDGKKWSNDYAEVAELERLERFNETSPWNDRFSDSKFPGLELLTVIVGDGGDRPDYRDSLEFWEGNDASEEWQNNTEYVHGFAMGAIEVWNKAKNQI
jgi:hypothetical protein